jgi:transcriptional regulator with XRE-family HTH domain
MRFIDIRKILGLNISQMAQAFGVHRYTYVKWERAERNPSDAVKRLADIFMWMAKDGLFDCYMEDFLQMKYSSNKDKWRKIT